MEEVLDCYLKPSQDSWPCCTPSQIPVPFFFYQSCVFTSVSLFTLSCSVHPGSRQTVCVSDARFIVYLSTYRTMNTHAHTHMHTHTHSTSPLIQGQGSPKAPWY